MPGTDGEIICKPCNDLRRAYFAEIQPFEILTIRRNVILTSWYEKRAFIVLLSEIRLVVIVRNLFASILAK
jgi:hypothetical protein